MFPSASMITHCTGFAFVNLHACNWPFYWGLWKSMTDSEKLCLPTSYPCVRYMHLSLHGLTTLACIHQPHVWCVEMPFDSSCWLMLCLLVQMQTVSDRDVHDQEVETLGRKLTEAERDAAAANVCSASWVNTVSVVAGRYTRHAMWAFQNTCARTDCSWLT